MYLKKEGLLINKVENSKQILNNMLYKINETFI
jgi:hypothetical protein